MQSHTRFLVVIAEVLSIIQKVLLWAVYGTGISCVASSTFKISGQFFTSLIYF